MGPRHTRRGLTDRRQGDELAPRPLAYPFSDFVTSAAALHQLVREPWQLNVRRQLPALDAHGRAFLARCPFLLIGTADATGNCDVSPRGDAPGFVTPLDDKTLLIPERPGNRRADTLRSILDNPHVGLLCLIPGVDETFRVNGRAALVRDAALLERAVVHGHRPVLAIAIEVEECFLHCGRSFKRAPPVGHGLLAPPRRTPFAGADADGPGAAARRDAGGA